MKFLNYLTEKLIVIGGGQSYEQIVFLAGGAASGKGFAAKNFMEGNKFKIRDIDEYKEAFLELNRIKGLYPELNGLVLKNPKDVFTLHSFVKAKGIKSKTLELLLSDVHSGRLPNIMFDMVSDDPKDIYTQAAELVEHGYDPKNIHIVWVLTNYDIAVQNNKNRERVVPSEVLLKAHVGVANTITDLLRGKIPQLNRQTVDGGIYVILNNPENTIVMTTDDTPDTIKNQQQMGGDIIKQQTKMKELKNGEWVYATKIIIKDFKYLHVKEAGKPITTETEIKRELADWITKNIPKTKGTWNIRRRKEVV